MDMLIEYKITPDNSLYYYDSDGDGFGVEIFLPYDEDEDDGMITVVCGFDDDITYVRDDFTIYELFEAKQWVETKQNEGKNDKK